MSTRPPVHTDRRRAESFGTAALEYDRCRPRYPATLIADLVVGDGVRALDVGAGTGIASAQLSAAGADVLAIEPDARMARVAADKGLAVEQATFEEWDPGLRSFDLVVFAQSFHWVRPRSALEKVAALLEPGGRLALLWNRITPTSPSVDDLNAVYAGHLDVTARPSIEIEDETTTLLQECGFTVERRHVVEELHFGTDAWLDLVFTYSNHLALEPMSRAQLRSQLADRIGPDGVEATNDALAVVAVRRPQA